MTQIKFDPSQFVHISIKNSAPMPRGKIWPLCDLKFEGGCQSIALVPIDQTKMDGEYFWETPPEINGCKVNCPFHKRRCERC